MAPPSLNRGRGFVDSTSPSPSKVTKRSRKFTALRAPPKSPAHPNLARNVPRIHVTLPSVHSSDFPPHLRELMMSLTNDRYPGAPGTALAKAREASEREATRIRRERKRLADRQEELERLGVVVPGVSKNGTGAVNGNGKERRTRKGTPQSAAASARSASPGGAGPVRETRKSNGSRRTPNLVVDSEIQPVVGVTGADVGSSTLSSGRTRRPASRGSSPVPLTVVNAPLASTSSTGTTSAPFQSSPLASHSFDAEEGAAAAGKDALLTATKSPRPSKRKASALSQEVFADTASIIEESQAAATEGIEANGAEAPAKKARLTTLPPATSPLSTSPVLTAVADVDGVDAPEGAGGYDSDVSASGRLSRTTRTPKRFDGIQLRRSASRSSPVAATTPLPSAALAE